MNHPPPPTIQSPLLHVLLFSHCCMTADGRGMSLSSMTVSLWHSGV